MTLFAMIHSARM